MPLMETAFKVGTALSSLIGEAVVPVVDEPTKDPVTTTGTISNTTANIGENLESLSSITLPTPKEINTQSLDPGGSSDVGVGVGGSDLINQPLIDGGDEVVSLPDASPLTTVPVTTSECSALANTVVTTSALDSTNINTTTTLTNTEAQPVQAYAKLEGDTFCYYIRTLQVMLGRRAPAGSDQVDIHLGMTKGISRQHARLFYNFLNQRFELIVYGKNGAFVNDQFVEKGSTVPLEHRAKVQIGETTFTFLLPKMELQEALHGSYNYLTNSDDLKQSLHTVPEHQYSRDKDSLLVPENQSNTGFQRNEKGNGSSSLMSGSNGHGATQGDANGNRNGSPTAQTAGTPNSGEAGDVEMFDTSEYSNKDVKPPFSYASLIAQAINTTPNKKLTLNGIYNYITSHYPYYQMAQNGWQNSIRHNLSLNKAFIKVPRGDNEPGKGAFWTIDASCEGQFRNGVYRKTEDSPAGKPGAVGEEEGQHDRERRAVQHPLHRTNHRTGNRDAKPPRPRPRVWQRRRHQ